MERKERRKESKEVMGGSQGSKTRKPRIEAKDRRK